MLQYSMEINGVMFYVEANVVCIVIFLMMFIREMRTVGWLTKQQLFINIILCHIFYFLSDICGTLVLNGYLPNDRIATPIVNTLIVIFLCAITGFWFVYTELSQGEKYVARLKQRILLLVPGMIEVAAVVFLFVFFPDTLLTADNQPTDLYYVLFLTVPLLYVVASAVRAIPRAFRRENYAVRTQYLVCAIYPVIITFFGVIETLTMILPMFCFGSAIMMLYVYILSLNDQVSIDELTRLNNRTQLKKYVTTESAKQNADKTMRYVLMIDLNKFKQINDQYGHVEGDVAFKRTADALKSACAGNTMNTFIARYGGDEFIIIAKTSDEKKVQDLCNAIKTTLIQMNTEASASYELTASIGYASYAGDITAYQAALAEADEALYKDKAARKAAG